jgi:hypothetical protein
MTYIAQMRKALRYAQQAIENWCDAIPESKDALDTIALEAIQAALTAAPQAPAPALNAGVVQWEPLTQDRLSSEEFDGVYWLAIKGGGVVAGEYEWRQGWAPHGFNTQDQGRLGIGEVTHTARFVKPQPPTIDAAMSAQAEREMCFCGDRPANQCDEEWGPECDLGNNEKYCRVATPQPVVLKQH